MGNYRTLKKITYLRHTTCTQLDRHDKTNNMTVPPAKTKISIRPVWSESPLSAWRTLASAKTQINPCIRPVWSESQPGHPPSLIRVFTVRMKKVWVLSYPLSLGIRPVWSESSLPAWRKFGSLATHWAWASAQSDQSRHCPHEESLGP